MIAAWDAAGASLRPLPIYLEGKLPIAQANTAKELGLKDHQIVQANIESQSGDLFLRLSNGDVRLPIPRDVYQSWHFPKNSPLQFRVQFQSDGSIVLRPLGAATVATEGFEDAGEQVMAEEGIDVLPDRFTQLFFRPQTLAALQNLLQPGVLEQLTRQTGQWPIELMSWLRSRPSISQLDGERLRAWLMQSGWFNEALLAQGRPLIANDLKSSLRSLLKHLRPYHESDAKKVEDAMDDIESGQLLEVSSSQQASTMAGVMLAFQDAPPIRIQIRKNKTTQEDAASSFSVDIEMQTSDWGTVWLKTKVYESFKVELTMWSEHPALVKLAQHNAPSLQRQMQAEGLQMTALQIIHGRAPLQRSELDRTHDSGQMLDVRT